MRALFTLVVFGLLIGRVIAFDERTIHVEHSKSLPDDGSLGSRPYAPTRTEKNIIKDWSAAELKSDGDDTEKLTGYVGKRVAWFGIVREIKEDKEAGTTRLLVEMKYFDGITDLHQQIVSINGAGDFSVKIPGSSHKMKPLSLVRVYGKVAEETKGVPEIAADYVRCWDWKLFAFMAYGKDNGNPKWVKLRKVNDDVEIYDSHPIDRYYEERLGKR